MGPKNGDELNLIQKGKNYGWPVVSEGSHYSGIPIPPHETRPEFQAPMVFWNPTIAPSGLDFYEGDEFPSWQGNALIGGLRSRALIRVAFDEDGPKEKERFHWSKRVRDVEVCQKGFIWVIEDGNDAKLIKFTNSTKS
jgi:glucose/arabinose dehydrogenase